MKPTDAWFEELFNWCYGEFLMVFKVYVIVKEHYTPCSLEYLYYSSFHDGKIEWVKSCMFEDIKYFTKKKLAEEVLNSINDNDTTMMVKVISLEMV